jgi:small multidrug resistance pump
MSPWFYLSIAIVSEVIATSALKAADGFSRLGPSLVVITGYALAFFFLSLTLKTLPLGVAYAIWSGAGVALIALIGWAWYGQALDAIALVGIALIVAGVVILNLCSKAGLRM